MRQGKGDPYPRLVLVAVALRLVPKWWSSTRSAVVDQRPAMASAGRRVMTIYYQDEWITLYHGDCRKVVRTLPRVDAIVTDPPYGETSLEWDRWPDGWPAIMSSLTESMWVFGSMRMFLDRSNDFAGWKLSQDVVWEKHNGSGFANDRFKRVHEHATHWFRGVWGDRYHETPTTLDALARPTMRRKARPPHMGQIGKASYQSEDGGPLLMRSVIYARSMQGSALHPTEKPVGILTPLIEYATAPGQTILDPFAGSGSTLDAARRIGRNAIGIEADERYCEIAARRLSQGVMEFPA